MLDVCCGVDRVRDIRSILGAAQTRFWAVAELYPISWAGNERDVASCVCQMLLLDSGMCNGVYY